MARIRSIKPEFFQSKSLARCSPHARLLAIALLQLCDARGVFQYIPMQVHAHAFPWEADVNSLALLQELESAGYVFFYEVNGKEYGCIPGFEKHQRLSGKEAQSSGIYPTPDQGLRLDGGAGEVAVISQGSEGESRNREQGTGNRDKGSGKRKRVLVSHDLFERWYRVYPNKKAKAQARKAWDKIKPDRQLTAQMIRAVRMQTRWRDARERAGLFVPEWKHPGTWLSSESWEDELDWPKPKAVDRERVMEEFD